MIGVEAQKRRGRAEKPWDDPRTGAHRSSGGTARKPAPLFQKSRRRSAEWLVGAAITRDRVGARRL